MTGRKRRLGFGKRGKNSFTVQRSEEVGEMRGVAAGVSRASSASSENDEDRFEPFIDDGRFETIVGAGRHSRDRVSNHCNIGLIKMLNSPLYATVAPLLRSRSNVGTKVRNPRVHTRSKAC